MDNTKKVSKTTHYFYDNPMHYLPTRTATTDSKHNKLVTYVHYPQDYIPYGGTQTGNAILDTMIGRNILAEAIEKSDSLYYSGSSTGYITGAQLNLYRIQSGTANTIVPDKVYKLDIQSPATNFQPFSVNGNNTSQDGRYEQKISFDGYDGSSNIDQYTPEDQVAVSYLWDYARTYPIAKITGAPVGQAAYTSFEADGTGNWIMPSTAKDSSSAFTGKYCYFLTSSPVSCSGLTSSATYVVSYWSKTGSSFTVANSTSVKQGKTVSVNGANWTYFEHTVTGTSTVSVSSAGGGDIDELRLYPAKAQMTTYTYAPEVGMTTACDVDKRATYYFYDALGRLSYVKDQDGNIIKTYRYHYEGQTGN
jgi:hypothetical protein